MLRPLIAVAACAQVLLPSILSAAVHVPRAHHYHERASLPRPGRLWGKPRAGGAGLPQQAGEDTVAWGAGWRAMRPDCHIGVWTAALGGSGRHAGACAVVFLAISQLCAMPYWGSQRSARRGCKRCAAARNWRQCGRIFIESISKGVLMACALALPAYWLFSPPQPPPPPPLRFPTSFLHSGGCSSVPTGGRGIQHWRCRAELGASQSSPIRTAPRAQPSAPRK